MAQHASTHSFSGDHSSPVAPSHTRKPSAHRDRDSGVFLSDSEEVAHTPRPSPQTHVSFKGSPSTTPRAPSRTDSITQRLRRPAELNLSSPQPEPKSELQLRHDLIRNTSTRTRAALKSPTQLLHDRLNMSPQKVEHEEKIRIFTPPRPMLNGCILPGPQKQLESFCTKDVDVCARTERGRPAWWCKVDKLVVFDGVIEGGNQAAKADATEKQWRTRTGKGLSISRRRGDAETIIIPMDCAHCQEMLNRSEWKMDVRVCKRSVCWECKERCAWELEKEQRPMSTESRGTAAPKEHVASTEGNRDRADSVLQDEQQAQDVDLMKKIGIEQGPKSPIDSVGGIEERLGVVM